MKRVYVLGVIVMSGALATAAAQLGAQAPAGAPGAPGQGAPPGRGGGAAGVQPIKKINDTLYWIPGAGGNTAVYLTANGVVLVDKSYCVGCRYCVQACPYGCRYINPETQTVDKCTLCYHRITKGLTTACCEACPTGARQLVDLKNPKDPVHEFLRANNVQILKPHLATGAKVYYKDLHGAVR